MQTNDSIKIVTRFFAVLDLLKKKKEIRGINTFTERYGINRRNMLKLVKEPERDIFQPAWLSYLVADYNVSPMWLLTGEGAIFTSGN